MKIKSRVSEVIYMINISLKSKTMNQLQIIASFAESIPSVRSNDTFFLSQEISFNQQVSAEIIYCIMVQQSH